MSNDGESSWQPLRLCFVNYRRDKAYLFRYLDLEKTLETRPCHSVAALV